MPKYCCIIGVVFGAVVAVSAAILLLSLGLWVAAQINKLARTSLLPSPLVYGGRAL